MGNKVTSNVGVTKAFANNDKLYIQNNVTTFQNTNIKNDPFDDIF